MKNKSLKPIIILLLSIYTQHVQPNCLNAAVINVAPYGFKSSTGQIQGIHWDYLEAISQESGICIHKKLLPYTRVLKNLEKGLSDISIISVTADNIPWLNPIVQMSKVKIIVIPHKDVKITQYDDLKNLIIGKMRGTSLNPSLVLIITINKFNSINKNQQH